MALVHGGLFLVLTVLFATVEEIAETMLARRLEVPDGVGAWMGAAATRFASGAPPPPACPFLA